MSYEKRVNELRSLFAEAAKQLDVDALPEVLKVKFRSQMKQFRELEGMAPADVATREQVKQLNEIQSKFEQAVTSLKNSYADYVQSVMNQTSNARIPDFGDGEARLDFLQQRLAELEQALRSLRAAEDALS